MGKAKRNADELASADSAPLVDADGKTRVVVTDEAGAISLTSSSRLPYAPADIYRVLTEPTSEKIFRSIQACTHRQILEEDRKRGRRLLAVTHRAISRFLFICVTFETHLYVWEDDHAHTIRFANAREGFMKRFEGAWRIYPGHVTPPPHLRSSPLLQGAGKAPTLESGLEAARDAAWHAPHWLSNFNPGAMVSAATRLVPHGGHGASSSLVTLEQLIEPKACPPPGVKSLMKRLVSKQLRDMLEDLQKELQRRQSARAGAGAEGKPAGGKAGTMAATASVTHAWEAAGLSSLLWDQTTPLINVTIQL